MNIDQKFKSYWEARMSFLCDEQIKREKKRIRMNWRALLPDYLDFECATNEEETQALINSDEEYEETYWEDFQIY